MTSSVGIALISLVLAIVSLGLAIGRLVFTLGQLSQRVTTTERDIDLGFSKIGESLNAIRQILKDQDSTIDKVKIGIASHRH